VEERVLRGLPTLVVIDADSAGDEGMQLCARLKGDAYTAIVPLAVCDQIATRRTPCGSGSPRGADEVITPLFEPGEQAGRLDALVTRPSATWRVNPSTRLPGTTEIEREIKRRMDLGEFFAPSVTPTSITSKNTNDRYSYYDGDRVIYLLSRILHDVVRGILGKQGFVGHIRR